LQIVYSAYVDGSASGGNIHYDIYLIQEDGQGRVALATSPDSEYPCGSTSDGRVVFTRMQPLGTTAAPGPNAHGIWIVNADGTGKKQLRSADDEVCFGVTANNLVVFARGALIAGSPHDIYSVKADGTNATSPTPLATSWRDDRPLGLSSDNRVIFGRVE